MKAQIKYLMRAQNLVSRSLNKCEESRHSKHFLDCGAAVMTTQAWY